MIKHTEHMRVNWVDTDASGLIHYTAALRYFETAEHALMRKIFPAREAGVLEFFLPRVHVEADYKSALRYPDEFRCSAWVAALGRSSVTYSYEVERAADGVVCIRGKIIGAAIDLSGQSIPLPPAFREALERAM